VKTSNCTKKPQATSKRRVFVDLYIQSKEDRRNNTFNLVARFKGPLPAKRAIEQPGFLLDLMHSDDVIFMTTSVGTAGEPAKTLPVPGDSEEKTWWKGYARLSGRTPLIFWSLIWPRPVIEDDSTLSLIMND
jgi:hypothetical protein